MKFSALLVLAAAALTLGGCVTNSRSSIGIAPSLVSPAVAARYAAIDTEKFPIDGIDAGDLNPAYVRQVVDYTGSERPGTIVVEPRKRFLYLVLEDGKALRYGVGVGKAGLAFTGTAEVGRKAEWPNWAPTANMIAREPERYGKLAGGMSGGVNNPLGPRALYLYRGGKDTMFRIHGTTEPWTIGEAVSSGCIRMLNQDVVDLYERVPAGSKVVVR
ncbi:L,D-transpeptidase [Rhodopseudomonas sp. HC1]|uniref:L,D-transpeptidase n=1 Tax=Rhodopseudomonas infernalis TaxID=2897386 RepID=UPI001EE78FC5|nr:L,D-transpeptidase [Rhodopseudomonas infernalis]MCG6203979.1 L,D-transpeptidase [Rhodopseudomonas infernalis]